MVISGAICCYGCEALIQSIALLNLQEKLVRLRKSNLCLQSFCLLIRTIGLRLIALHCSIANNMLLGAIKDYYVRRQIEVQTALYAAASKVMSRGKIVGLLLATAIGCYRLLIADGG